MSKQPIHITKNHQYRCAVVATKQGYIRILDGDTLMTITKKRNLIIQLASIYGIY